MPQNNELRVFISSTFRDLQEEREHLIKKIFPEIRSLCRARGIRFTEVDLRWGLTDEDVGLGRVIRTCLEEVDKCRPYFIGITGDRYGFIPSHLDIQKDPALLESYPWIEDVAVDGMSITEMEAHYALLGVGRNGIDKAPAARARFYFRRHRESFQDDPGENEELRLLGSYQERIEASGASVERFRDPVSLGELIFDDLAKIIKQDFADAKPPTPLEHERSRHEAFSLSRRRAYIPNPTYLKRLNDHAASDDPPLVVYAESGSGKSSLFAFWAEQYRRKNPEAHVIEHYVGIGATATDHYAVIRHVCMEINERFGRTEEIPTEPVKLDLALGQWLGYADHELRKQHSSSDSSLIPASAKQCASSLIIILDGLNQLQGTALNLRWIPDVIPPSIRLILSSTVEGTLVELKKRGWQQFGMQALSEAERETIVVRYLAEYRKSLLAEQVQRIAGDHKCGHPLFLKTLLEELRLVGRHEELDGKINSYLAATGTEDLFQLVLERLEEDYNVRAVRDVMTLLSASRSGLDERELSDLSSLARLKIATMMAGLDYHLVKKEGRLTFFHDYLRRAVEKRYLSDDGKLRSTHLKIAEYFQSGVSSAMTGDGTVPVRMASELAYQLHAGGATDRLQECLSTMPVFLALYESETHYEVMRYWSAMGEEKDIEGSYRRGLEQWSLEDAGERSRGLGRVTDLLERLGRWAGAIELERERCATAITLGDRAEEAASHRSLGWLLQMRGEYPESLEELSRAQDLYTELGDRHGGSKVIGNMGYVYFRRGEFDQALECTQHQLSIAEELDDRSEISLALHTMGHVYVSRGEYDRALESYERQLNIAEELGDRRIVSFAIGSMGNVYISRREYGRALESCERCLSIAEELGDRRSVAAVIGNMGIVYFSRGEYDRAIESFERVLRISEELGDHSSVSIAFGYMGRVYGSRGEYDRALECVQRQLSICEELGDRLWVAHSLEAQANVILESLQSQPPPSWLAARLNLQDGASLPAAALHVARESATRALVIASELDSQSMVFANQCGLARIDAAEGHGERARANLQQMLDEQDGDEERADCHYWLWRISRRPSDSSRNEGEAAQAESHADVDDHGYEALRLYTLLHQTKPMHEFGTRIEELTAALIPPEVDDATE